MKTEVVEISPEFPDLQKIAYCASIIRKGGLVVFPTETVYGIAADYTNQEAMERLQQVKKRSDGKPFSVLISQRGLISNYTSMTDPILYKLIYEFWPGPLTVVVPSREEGKTVGIRMPDNQIAQKLTAEAQCPVAAPSANKEGNEPPVTCREALKELDGLVDVAIDGGVCDIGKSSSVVDLTHGNPRILREGVISQEDVERVARTKHILFVCTGNSCRSVMAEYMLREATRHKDDIDVSSAGTGVFIQSTASSETISVLREEGIDATGHVSQPISSILLKKADLIFVMTRGHRSQVLERVPSVEKRLYLLREFSNAPESFQTELDIPDPIGRSHKDYKDCLAVIKESIMKITDLI